MAGQDYLKVHLVLRLERLCGLSYTCLFDMNEKFQLTATVTPGSMHAFPGSARSAIK